MPDRSTVPVPLPLRTDELVNLLLHKPAEHTAPDLDRQREQPLVRCPNQLPQCLLHALREHGLITWRLSDRYVVLHGGSFSRPWLIARHAPTRSGPAGGTAVTSKFYEPRDNLAWSTTTLHRKQKGRRDRRCSAGAPLAGA
jgi:hypothetical protein